MEFYTRWSNNFKPVDPARARPRSICVRQDRPTSRNSDASCLLFPLEELEKNEQTKPNPSRRKGIIKTGAEVNEIEIKMTIQKVNKTKS